MRGFGQFNDKVNGLMAQPKNASNCMFLRPMPEFERPVKIFTNENYQCLALDNELENILCVALQENAASQSLRLAHTL
jgi:hypothetical protein